MLQGHKRFAIFLCNFTDSVQPMPRTPEDYQNAFFNGQASINQYWLDISRGNCDIIGSQLFGWLSMGMTIQEFRDKSSFDSGGGVMSQDRGLALQAMQTVLGVNELNGQYSYGGTTFDYIIGIFSDTIGDEGNIGNGVVGDNARDTTRRGDTHTYFCHEMAHAMCGPFGVDHSFDYSERKSADWSRPGEYFNRNDIMSAKSVNSTTHPILSQCGPNFCAVYREKLGWIPQHRIQEFKSGMNNEIEIVSRSHPEIDGIELVKIRDLYIEFITAEGWDAGVNSGIAINVSYDRNAYVKVNDSAKPNAQVWTNGMIYGKKPSSNPSISELLDQKINGFFYIEILTINNQTKKAKIRIVDAKPSMPILSGTVLIGVSNDGPGYVIVNGRVKRIPPRSPVVNILTGLSKSILNLAYSMIRR